MADQVKLKVAHPLDEDQAVNLGQERKALRPGEEITVSRDAALAVINQGYAAGVDPQDRQAVRKALGDVETAAQETAGQETAGQETAGQETAGQETAARAEPSGAEAREESPREEAAAPSARQSSSARKPQ